MTLVRWALWFLRIVAGSLLLYTSTTLTFSVSLAAAPLLALALIFCLQTLTRRPS